MSLEKIENLLRQRPIEAGVIHPAERLLEEYLDRLGEFGLDECARSASWLHLLGRSSRLSTQLRERLVQSALDSDDVEIRDAAVQAIENWQDISLFAIVRLHKEPVEWLQSYITDLTCDGVTWKLLAC